MKSDQKWWTTLYILASLVPQAPCTLDPTREADVKKWSHIPFPKALRPHAHQIRRREKRSKLGGTNPVVATGLFTLLRRAWRPVCMGPKDMLVNLQNLKDCFLSYCLGAFITFKVKNAQWWKFVWSALKTACILRESSYHTRFTGPAWRTPPPQRHLCNIAAWGLGQVFPTVWRKSGQTCTTCQFQRATVLYDSFAFWSFSIRLGTHTCNRHFQNVHQLLESQVRSRSLVFSLLSNCYHCVPSRH